MDDVMKTLLVHIPSSEIILTIEKYIGKDFSTEYKLNIMEQNAVILETVLTATRFLEFINMGDIVSVSEGAIVELRRHGTGMSVSRKEGRIVINLHTTKKYTCTVEEWNGLSLSIRRFTNL